MQVSERKGSPTRPPADEDTKRGRNGTHEQLGRRADAVLTVLPDSLAVLDHNGTVVAVNETWRRFAHQHGAAPLANSGVGLNYLAVCRAAAGASSEGAKEAEAGIRAVLERRQALFTLEYPCHSPTAQSWFLLRATPLAGGRREGVVVSHVDITERKRLEQRTQEALQALLAMAEALTSSVPTVPGPPDEIAVRVAAAARSVLGCARVALLAIDPETERMRPLGCVGWPAVDERQWYADAGRVHLTGYLSPESVTRLRGGDFAAYEVTSGAQRLLPRAGPSQVFIAPLRLGADLIGILALDYGTTPHTFMPAEDTLPGTTAHLAALVLQRDRLYQEREAALVRERTLQETTQRMDEFLATASHDLRSPVTVAMAGLHFAARRFERLASVVVDRLPELADLTGGVRRNLSDTSQSVDRLARMVNLLFDTALVRTGTLQLHRAPCDLAAVVREPVEALRQAFPRRTIDLQLPRAGPVPVEADADRLGQVVTNYLTNALKYSPENQPVGVRLQVRDGQVARIAVTDHGPGLPHCEQRRIWERFYRAEGIRVQSGTGLGVGLGLGLHICKTIVEAHGGQVGVDSKVGQGSTFWLSLPIADASDRGQPNA